MLKLQLSRRRSGLYCLTKLPMIRHRVFGHRYDDLYLTPGEPVGIMNICSEGTEAFFGITLEPLASCVVTLSRGKE